MWFSCAMSGMEAPEAWRLPLVAQLLTATALAVSVATTTFYCCYFYFSSHSDTRRNFERRSSLITASNGLPLTNAGLVADAMALAPELMATVVSHERFKDS